MAPVKPFDFATANFTGEDIARTGAAMKEAEAQEDYFKRVGHLLTLSEQGAPDPAATYQSPWTELKEDFARELVLGTPSQLGTTVAGGLAGGAALTNPVTAPFAVPIGMATGATVGGGIDYLMNVFRPEGKQNSPLESGVTGVANLVGGKFGKTAAEGVSDVLASTAKKEADAVLANPRALKALETYEAKKGGITESLDAFREGRLTGDALGAIKTTEATQRTAGKTFEDRFADSLEQALIPRSDAAAKLGINKTLKDKVKPVARDILESGILDAPSVKELAERAAIARDEAYQVVLDAVEGKEVSTAPFALTGQKLIALADKYKNTPEADDIFRGMVEKGKELIKKYGNPNVAFDFRPAGSAPHGPLMPTMPAMEALEMQQVMNEVERSTGRFTPENIAKAMTGSSIATSPQALQANFSQLREAISNEVERVAGKGVIKNNQLYGAYDAIEKAARLAETEASRASKNASTRLIPSADKGSVAANVMTGLTSPRSQNSIQTATEAVFGPASPMSDDVMQSLRAAEQPENIMTELRGNVALAQSPGSAIRPSRELERYVGESRIRRAVSPSELFDPRNPIRSAIPQAALGAGAQAGVVEGLDALLSADEASASPRDGNSQGPLFKSTALGSTKVFPPGTNANDPYLNSSGKLFPPEVSAEQTRNVLKQVQRDAQTKAQNIYRMMPGQVDPYPQGFPRELEGLDPEVFAERFLEKTATDPMRSIIAKQLVDSFSLAHKQNDITKREKIYEAMSTTFPEYFKAGWGVNGRIWDKTTQQGYLARIQRDAGVDAQFLAMQKSAFNDRTNPQVLQIPAKKVTQADVQAQQRAGQKRVQLPDGSYDIRQ